MIVETYEHSSKKFCSEDSRDEKDPLESKATPCRHDSVSRTFLEMELECMTVETVMLQ